MLQQPALSKTCCHCQPLLKHSYRRLSRALRAHTLADDMPVATVRAGSYCVGTRVSIFLVLKGVLSGVYKGTYMSLVPCGSEAKLIRHELRVLGCLSKCILHRINSNHTSRVGKFNYAGNGYSKLRKCWRKKTGNRQYFLRFSCGDMVVLFELSELTMLCRCHTSRPSRQQAVVG